MSTERICGTGSWNGPLPGDPDNNIGIQAVGAVAGIKVTWGYPGINPHAVAHGKLYRSNSATNPGNVIAIVNGSMFFDSLEPEDLTTYYYWIELVSVNGTVADKVGPASAKAESYGDDLYTHLADKIDEGVLATSLRQKIDRIGLNSLGLTNEILERAKTEDALGAAYNIVEAHSGDTRALLEEEVLARTTANEAFVAQVNTLYASKAEIYYQGTAPTGGSLNPLKVGAFWFDTSDGDKSYRWNGSSWQPVNTATIDQTNAAVQDNNRAMIGYCAVNGSPSQHLTAEACSAAGGSWVAAAPFAQALKTVQVTDAEGNMASVQQRMESYQTTLGELGALYTVQVDNNGLVGGFGVYNDGSEVSAGFNVNKFWIGKPGDDHTSGNYPFIIEGDQINFNGVVSFSNIQGEGTPEPGATRNTFVGDWSTSTSYKKGDIVMYNGNGWTAKSDHYSSSTRRPPGLSTGYSSYWNIHTIKGDTPTVSNNGNGTYDITGDNGTITVHDGTDAPIPTVTDLGSGRYRINDGSGNTVTVEDGYTPQKGIDYFDGTTGDYHSWIYRETNNTPNRPTGGSFTGTSETIPSYWRDTPPNNPSGIVWVSTNVYRQYAASDSRHPNWYRTRAWSIPSKFYEKGEDGAVGQGMVKGVAFRRTTANISSWGIWGGSFNSPTPISSGWHDGIPDGTSPLWMTSRLFTSDGRSPQESSWAPAKKVAELGQSVKVQFWESGRSWSNTARSTSTHMRTCTSTDGGNNWVCESAVKIKGEKGDDGRSGDDGQNGDSTITIYRARSSVSRPSDSTGIPSYWSTTPPTSGIIWECIGNRSGTSSYWRWGEPKISADYWRKPYKNTIDGNKIFTGDAYVDTLQIKGNAVTIPKGSYTSSGLTLGTSWTTISSIYVNSQGNPTQVLSSFSYFARAGYNTGDCKIEVRLVRAGSIVRLQEVTARSTEATRFSDESGTVYTYYRDSGTCCFAYLDDNQISNVNYYTQVRKVGSGSASIARRYIGATGLQR